MHKFKKLGVENSYFYDLVLTVCPWNLFCCLSLLRSFLIVANKWDELTYAQLLTASNSSDFSVIHA